MSGQRVEVQHHTIEQVAGYIKTTRELLDVGVGFGKWDGAMFAAVVGLVASKTINVVQPQPIDLDAIVPRLNNARGLR